jgi:hypothetical protein
MLNKISSLLLLPLLFIGCNSNPLDVDVSKTDLDLDVYRYEVNMFNAQSVNDLALVNASQIQEGGELYEFYVMEMLSSGSPYHDSIANTLFLFTQDSIMKMVNNNVQKLFGDFKNQQTQMIDMFKHLKYHIPHAMLPTNVITYNSTFANGVVSTPTQIGLGLEMYLGNDNEIIKQLPYPNYFKTKMEKEYLMADIAQSWIEANVLENNTGDQFLSNMIYNGKLLYLIDAMLPNAEDHLKIRYSKAEYDWAELSEFNIWKHIVEQNWIYSTDMKLVVRYFKPGPTTVGLEGSPSKIGQYLGWKIIKAYMDKNPEVTVQKLIAEKNHTKILKAYKPKDNK